ncbi:FtsX-like permease family protein [Methanoregula sp.]|uniref:ABC transporter permease n=1 Tax=Methanoregula sp. TaxID=2052170 RepID=UPI00237405D8|nr:FtsX-like permease family protein [Methanoregula sp.]MDD1687867.1 ABC transporter permease [Methanoregula sp.]
MTKLVDYAKLSARQLMKKRMRVFLTAFGIAIGIAAVVGIISFGEGIRYQAIETIKQQSDLTLIEVTGSVRDGTVIPITESKVSLIQKIPHVEAAGPVYQVSFSTLRQTYISVTGISGEDLQKIFKPSFASGGMYDPASNQVIFGHELAEKLQKYEGVRQGDLFTVVIRDYDPNGAPSDRKLAIQSSGALRERGDSLDSLLLMDRDSVSALSNESTPYNAVYVRVDNPEHVFAVVDEIQSLGLSANGSFRQIESVNRLMDLVILFLSIFAAISLIVGALMIVNTMIMSVYERTREIGVSMALGASQGDVVTLILMECLYIGVIGGLLGDLLGIVFSWAINSVGKAYLITQMGDMFSGFARYDLTLVTPEILVMGFLVAVVLSLLSGIYPALQAARLNPVDAIRHT